MEYFNNSVGRNLQYPQMELIFARYYNLKGAKMADEGDLQKALENFNKSIELNPNYAIALFNRATIKADLGDFRGAKEDFLRAKHIEIEQDEDLDPDITDYHEDEISEDKINFF
jgi:tetratricopeptide (TPR) repeat protein